MHASGNKTSIFSYLLFNASKHFIPIIPLKKLQYLAAVVAKQCLFTKVIFPERNVACHQPTAVGGGHFREAGGQDVGLAAPSPQPSPGQVCP
jgi:hypothetical protein